MRSASLFLLCAGMAGAAAAGVPAMDDRLAVQVTSEVSTGSMDTPSGVPVRESNLSVRYRDPRWTAQVDVPWRRVAGLPEAATPAVAGSRFTDASLGETRMKLVVPLRRGGPAATGLDLVLRAQTGTRTAVGAFDTVAAGQSVRLASWRELGDWRLSGHFGWRRAGDLPGTGRGRNAWQGEVGLSRMLTPRIEAGGSAYWRQAVGGDPAYPEATLHLAMKDGDGQLQVFASRAFAPASPYVAVGLSYRATF
jgi:hypothetical protein